MLSLKNILKTAALLMLPLFLFTACDSDDDNGTNPQPQEMSYLRVAHLSSDAPAVDVWVDGNLVLEDVTYEAFSAFLEIAAGDHNILVVAANTTEPAVIDADVSLLADVSYTVAATGLLSGNGESAIAPLVITDDRSPNQDNAKVRFVHTGSDAPAVSIYAVGGDTPLFDNISFREASDYLTVPPGTVGLEVRTAAGDALVLRFADINLNAGTNYTVFAKGLLDAGGADMELGALAAVDAPGSGATTVPLVAVGVDFSMLRVGHLVPDAPEVDVYLDNMLVLEDVSYLEFSDYLMVESGDYMVKVTPANDPNTAVIDASVNLMTNINYTVTAVGLLADNSIAPAVFTEDLTASGGVKVRFIHASPNAPAVDLALRDGDVLFDNISFPSSGDYQEVAGGTYDFDVLLESTDEPALLVNDVPLTDGVIYSVFAVGLAGNTTTPLTAIAVVDDASAGSQVVPLNTSSPSFAQLRIGHLSPDAPNVDVYVNESMIASNVPYQAFSPYLDVLAERDTRIQVYATGTTTNPVIDATLSFDPNTATTVAATGLLGDGSFGPVILTDDLSTSNDARVRFFHASPDAPNVDITLTDGTVLFDDFEFNEAADYLGVAAGEYDLQVRVSGSETVVVSFGSVALDAASNYTVIATGLAGDGSLAAIALIDTPGDGSMVAGLTPAISEVRVGHLSPDAPNVDVYVDGGLLLSDVPFGVVSGYVETTAASHDIEVYVTGATETPVIAATLTLLPGEAYTVAATGLVADDDLHPIVLIDDRSPAASGDAHVRFVHTSPDAPMVDIQVAGGDPVLFDDIAFRESGGYIPVGPSTYDLEVALSSNGQVVLPVDDLEISGATNYTIFAVGLAGDGSLTAHPVVDTP